MTAVLLRSRRRCCVCHGLNDDLTIKQGQIAHLDHNPSNNDEDNLVFLCLDHHDQYDSRTSQSKGLTEAEVRHFRMQLDQVPVTSTVEQSVLEIRPSPGQEVVPFVERAHGETHFRMEINNPPQAGPAHNVQVKLVQIDPLPQSEYLQARLDLPYVVRLAHLADTVVDNTAAHDINPGASRQFELLYFWESSDHRLMVNGINTKQEFRDARFEIEDGECWHMTYEISSAEARIQRPVFRVSREGMNLLVSRQG
jgi:hypothetical protein